MKIVTQQLSAIVANFASNMADFLYDYSNDSGVTSVEVNDSVNAFTSDLKTLLTGPEDRVTTLLRKLFKEGHTGMLVGHCQFEDLETAYTNDEDFCLQIKKGKETFCILCKQELAW